MNVHSELKGESVERNHYSKQNAIWEVGCFGQRGYMNYVRGLIHDGQAVSCFFRSSVEEPYRKALLQITERCNLSCAHCFVSAGNYGDEMSLAVIKETVVPRLLECRVTRVT